MLWVGNRGRGAAALSATALMAVDVLAGCGSGDSTVAKTPQGSNSGAESAPPGGAAGPGAPPADPCAVDLTASAVTQAVAELPRDPRSQQPWNPEPLAGNYNRCTPLSAVIVAANTNAAHPNTRAVMFHEGQVITGGVPDTYGFTGIEASQSADDIVALQAPSGIPGLTSVVRFRWNGDGVELIGNTGGGATPR